MKSFPLYIHIPFCASKCAYCDFFSCTGFHEDKAFMDFYVESLIQSAAFYVKKYDVCSWKSVYIGGGTPSLLSFEQIDRLYSALFSLCPLEEDAECTFEANPSDISADFLKTLCQVGVNRLSIGIQSFDDAVLSLMGRRSSAQDIRDALLCIKKEWVGKKRFTADLIAGLPLQSDEIFMKGIKELLNTTVDHISLYSLMIEEGTPLYKAIEDGSLLYDNDAADRQWLLGRDYLESQGFFQYEISNFSKKGFESAHNMVYWKLQDYIGIGSGATGSVFLNDGSAYRWTGKKNVKSFFLNEPLVDDEVIDKKECQFEFLMMGFRTREGVDALEFKERFGLPLNDCIGETFSRWEKKGLAKKDERHWALTKDGLLWLNAFLEEVL